TPHHSWRRGGTAPAAPAGGNATAQQHRNTPVGHIGKFVYRKDVLHFLSSNVELEEGRLAIDKAHTVADAHKVTAQVRFTGVADNKRRSGGIAQRSALEEPLEGAGAGSGHRE